MRENLKARIRGWGEQKVQAAEVDCTISGRGREHRRKRKSISACVCDRGDYIQGVPEVDGVVWIGWALGNAEGVGDKEKENAEEQRHRCDRKVSQRNLKV